MTILQETRLYEFEFWGGALNTTKYLMKDDYNHIEDVLVVLYPKGIEKNALNDLFWHGADSIAQWLGFKDFADLIPPWD